MAQSPVPAPAGQNRPDMAGERTIPSGASGAGSPTLPAAPAAGMLTELKVSGHVMTLDTGLYCVVHKPGQGTQGGGLPGIRVSVPPGAATGPGPVEIAALRPDGWLAPGGDAALVRVNVGPAQVLVTIYQAIGAAERTAPNIQVMKLAEGVATPAPKPPAQPAAPVLPEPAVADRVADRVAADQGRTTAAPRGPAVMEMIAHIQERGDVGAMLGEWLGERGSKRWIEGFGLSPTHEVAPRDIEYQAVLGQGWLSPWVEGGQFCGSRAMALPLLGLRVRLRGDPLQTHDVTYAASFIDGTTVGPVANGEACEADSLAAMEAFQVILRRRAATPAPAATEARGRGKAVAKGAPPAAAPAPAPALAPARGRPAGRKR